MQKETIGEFFATVALFAPLFWMMFLPPALNAAKLSILLSSVWGILQ